ncbi:MAG: AMP-binding protein, partial [Cyanobacteria bacterium J06555_12]
MPTVTKDCLLKFAQENESTVADVLQACWQILLWKLTGEQAVTIHLLANGRDDENLEDVIGPLAKWLPLHYELQPAYQFTEVVDRVRTLSATAEDYQDSFGYGFANTENSETSLTEVYTNAIGFEWCENIDGVQSESETLTVEQQQVFNQRFKLALTCFLSNRGLTVELQYDRQRLKTSDIHRIHHQFLVLVDSALAHPEQPIEHLSVLDGGDRIQLLQTFNATTQSFVSINGVHTLFEEQVAQHPDNIAVTSGRQQLTYGQLNQKANQLARYLRQIGVGPDTIVGIYLLRSTSLVVALLAILKAGAAYLPLDPALSTEAVARRLADAHATALVSQTRLMPDAPESMSVIYPDENEAETIAAIPADNLPCLTQPNNLAYIIYTSGSTGAPKGVAIEHCQILNYLQAISSQLNLPNPSHFALVSTIAADLG